MQHDDVHSFSREHSYINLHRN